MTRVLAVITARGGSKGLTNKNVRMLAGKPLIAHTIDAALGLGNGLYRVIVSTDDEKTAAISRRTGAAVPFMRPSELAEDDTPLLPVVQHAARFVEKQDRKIMDWILLLQPTSPLRTTEDITAALDIALEHRPTAVVSVVESFDSHPMKLKVITDGALEPYNPDWIEGIARQDYSPRVYKTNGAIYLVRRDVLMEQNSLWGDLVLPFFMPRERSIDIDTEFDLRVATFLMETRNGSDAQSRRHSKIDRA